MDQPNAAIEIHDSTLLAVESDGDSVLAVLDAWVHRSTGRPGTDAGSVWLQKLYFRIDRARISGVPDVFPVGLCNGHLQVGAEKMVNVIALPMNRVGTTELALQGANDILVVIQGEGALVSLLERGRYREEFSGIHDDRR